MRRTRHLFVVSGYPAQIEKALNTLKFKGLKVFPPGKEVSLSDIDSAFKQNRSVVCSINDFRYEIPVSATLVHTMTDMSQFSNSSTNVYRFLDTSKEDVDIAEQFSRIAVAYGIDIGDPKSNSSGLLGEPSPDDCAYCKYLSDGFHYDGNERPVYMNKSFFAMPTVGQFRTGYLLIIPNKHIMSNAELNEEEINDLKEILDDLDFILRRVYTQDILVWENGSGKSGVGKAKDSIVHSHLHLCPSSLTSIDIERMSHFPFEDVTLDSLHEHKDHSYLLLRTPDKGKWRIVDSSNLYVPRQYVRQILAEECGRSGDEYNWRLYPFRREMTDTCLDIAWYLNAHWFTLPDRIKDNMACAFN